MPNIFLDQLPLILMSAVVALSLSALWQEHRNYQKLLKSNSTDSLEVARQKSTGILRRALTRAQEILGKAEVKSIDIISESEKTREKMAGQYEMELDKISEELKKSLPEQLQSAQKEFADYLTKLRLSGEQIQTSNQTLIKQKTDEIFNKFEKDLVAFLSASQQRNAAALDTEVQNMRQMIESYKKQQLSLVDENVIAMLERTLSLVMGKKISLQDEVDMVYEALDKAKAEKFII